nr:hypothetical protein [uncultured Ruegeria sp.]
MSRNYRPITTRFFDWWEGTIKYRGNRRMFLVSELIDHFAQEELEMTDVAPNHDAMSAAGRKGAEISNAKRKSA